jgi:hypothetical protein
MQIRLLIDDSSDIARAQGIAAELAVRCGFGEFAAERMAGAVCEAASHLLRMTDGGELLMRPLQEEVVGAAAPQVEVLVIERVPQEEPGMDGHGGTSTAPGTPTRRARLAGMRNSSTTWDCHGRPGRGAVFRLTLSPADRPLPIALPAVAVGAVWPCDDMAAKTGPSLYIHSTRSMSSVVVAVGRGTEPARRVASAQGFTAQSLQIARARAALPDGANMALAAAMVDADAARVRLAGAGHIDARVLMAADSTLGMPCFSPKSRPARADAGAGTDGRVDGIDTPWPEDALLVLHGGGGSLAAWSPPRDLLSHHPAVVAAVVYRSLSLQAAGQAGPCVTVCRRSAECLPRANAAASAAASAAADMSPPPNRRPARARTPRGATVVETAR